MVGYVEDPQEMLDELHKAALAEGNDYLVSPKLLSQRPVADLHRLYRDPENELVATNGTSACWMSFGSFGPVRPMTTARWCG